MILINKIYNKEILIKTLFVFAIFIIIFYFYFVARSVQASFEIEKHGRILEAEKIEYQKLERQYIDQIAELTEDDFEELGFVSIKNPVFIDRHTSVARLDD